MTALEQSRQEAESEGAGEEDGLARARRLRSVEEARLEREEARGGETVEKRVGLQLKCVASGFGLVLAAAP